METITAQINHQDLRAWVTMSAESRAAWREASALDEQMDNCTSARLQRLCHLPSKLWQFGRSYWAWTIPIRQ